MRVRIVGNRRAAVSVIISKLTKSIVLLVAAAAISAAQSLPARRSSDYDPNRRSGRFDLRLRVDGSVDIYIRGNDIRYRVRTGSPPTDEGSEYTQEIPRGEVMNLRVDQRDGRNPIRVVEEPSRRKNYTLALAIDDPQGGRDRYMARITWDDSNVRSPFDRGPGGRPPGRDRDDRDNRDNRDNRGPRGGVERGRILTSPPRDGACFYEDARYRGNFFCVAAGDSIDRIPPRFVGRIRSIQLYGRGRARLYADPNMRGGSTPIEFALPDTDRLRERLERFESVAVERR